jgi:hypothetical protein
VGPAQPLDAQAVRVPNGDLTQQGEALFFGLDCATCHGLVVHLLRYLWAIEYTAKY